MRETHDMIKTANQSDAMNRSSVPEWHKLFREGREQVEYVEYEQWSRCP